MTHPALGEVGSLLGMRDQGLERVWDGWLLGRVMVSAAVCAWSARSVSCRAMERQMHAAARRLRSSDWSAGVAANRGLERMLGWSVVVFGGWRLGSGMGFWVGEGGWLFWGVVRFVGCEFSCEFFDSAFEVHFFGGVVEGLDGHAISLVLRVGE